MPIAKIRFGVLCAMAICLAPVVARAQYTWVGGATGAGSLNFSSPANWNGAVPPSNTTTDMIFAGTTNTGSFTLKLNQDLSATFTFRSITFDATAGPFFIGGGRFVTDNGATITQSSANDQYFETQFSSSGPPSSTRTITLTGTAGGTGTVRLSGSFNDNGNRKVAVVKSGASATFVFGVLNGFTGGLTLNAGTLGIADPLGLGAGAFAASSGTLSLITDSAVTFTGTTTISGDVNLVSNRATSGTGVNHTFGDLTLGANKLSVYAGGSVTTGTAGATFGTTTLTINGATFDVGALANLSLGTLSGNFSFTKQGSGTLTLTNSSTRNASTAITAGTVVVSNATAIGNGSGSTVTINDATLLIAGVNVNNTRLTMNAGAALVGSSGSPQFSNFNPSIGSGAAVRFATAAGTDTLTINPAIMNGSNASLIAVSGPGTVSLASGSSAATAYAGSWLLNGVASTVLKLVNSDALGNPGGNNQRPITLQTGNLQLRAGATAVTFSQATTIAGSVGINPDSTVVSQSNNLTLGTLAVNDGLPAANTLTVTVGQGPGFNGSTTGSLIFGATTLSDNVNFAMSNISSGGSAVGGVTLGAIDDAGSGRTIGKSGVGTLFLTSAATSLVNGTAVNITGGTLASNATNALGTLANVTISTGAALNVGANQTVGAINSAASNTGNVFLNGNTLTVGSSNNLDSVFAGTFSGSGNLAKQGGGRLTLGGTSTYTGTTNITAGQFALSGTLTSGGGAVTVGDGLAAGSGTLMGSGTIQRSVTIDTGGTLAPGGSGAAGNGTGILHTNALAMNGGGTYVVEIADASDTSNAAAGAKFDQLQVTGAVTLNATSGNKFIFDITSLNAMGVNGNALNFDKLKNQDWVIAKTTSAAPDFTDRFVLLDHFTNDTSGVGGASDGAFSISGSGNDVVLRYSAAPEPGMIGLLCFGSLALMRRRTSARHH